MDNRLLQEYIDITKKLPPPVPPRIVTLLDDVNFMLCMCGKRKRKVDMPPRHSGVVRFHDNICRGCVAQAKDWAAVVCTRCKEVVARMEPGGKEKDGWTFKRNGIYHVVNCASCCPGLESVEIVERILWRQRNNLPIPKSS
jgi:hypothetical protein